MLIWLNHVCNLNITLIWTILVVEMNRWLDFDETVAISCVALLNTLLLVRVANMDNGNIAWSEFFFLYNGFSKQVK